MFKESLTSMVQLATSAFGLVAALAWNEAISKLFARIFGTRAGIVSLFVYAVLVTVMAVFITNKLGKMAQRANIEAEKKEGV